jgi:acetolactate synthase-1/2/3 large subunit
VVVAISEEMQRETGRRARHRPGARAAAAPRAGSGAGDDGDARRRSGPSPCSAAAAGARRARGDPRFLLANDLPVAVSFRRQGLFDNTSPNYAGDLGVGADAALVAKARECDLFLAIGTRMGEPVSQGYALLDTAGTATPIVHVHQDQAEIGRVYRPALGIAADLNAFAAAARAAAPVEDPPWSGWTRELRAAREAQAEAPEAAGPLNLARALQALEKALPPDTVFTTDAGNFATWPTRFMHVASGRTSSAPPTAPWATACRPRSAPPSCHPTAAWCASSATAGC